MKRVVETGDVELRIGASSQDIRLRTEVCITQAKEYDNQLHLPFFSRWRIG